MLKLLFVIVLIIGSVTAVLAEPRPYFTEPSLSPDRKEIAFVSGGDIWTVPAAGGVASLLVSHPANEARPFYSPDGRQLAFISSRTGNGDIYLLTLATGDLTRLTFDDGLDQLDGWSRDGRWIYFSSTSRDIGGLNDLYRVSVNGGTPMPVSADRYTNEFFCAPSPDGKTLAFSARGIASGQWWRKGHSHIDESEIWLLRSFDGVPASAATYERVTAPGGAKELWPMWSADGRSLFYVSDRTGAQNIWTTTPGRTDARRLSNFTDGRVLWPSISYDGREVVFEHDFAIWKLDTASGKASEVAITRRGASAGPAVERQRLTDQISELQLSPDGKKVAFVVRGEVFAASASDGGDAARVSNSAAQESQIAWAPDSRRLVYVSDRDGVPHLFLYDFTSNSETQLTRDAADDSTPRFSPDGKSLAFIRGAKDLRVLDVAAKTDRIVKTAIFERPPVGSDRPFVWSPDSKWIAYVPIAENQFRNVNVVAIDGSASGSASYLANVFNNTISWSPDGAYILFDSGQRTESTQLARIDLIPRTPRFREDQFRDLFREEPPRSVTPANRPEPRPTETPAPSPLPSASPGEEKRPAPKPVQVVFEDIRRRLSFVPVGLDVNYQTISPDGKWVALVANAANQANIYVYSLDELSREPAVAKQLTSTSGFKNSAQFSPDNKEIFFIDNGRIGVVNLEGRSRSLAVTAEMDIDFSREKMEVFRQGWSYLRDNFYDADYHGANWQAVRAEYEPLIEGSRTPDEMRRLMQLMVGELNASHLGAGAPPGGNPATTGRIGLRFGRGEYETSGRLRVTEVIALSPAAIAGNIKPGDYLLAVDGRTIDQSTNLDETLNYKIARRVSLTVSSSADGAGKREVVVRPVNAATERGLLYRQWVERNRAYVAKISNGRLGYAHMFDMSQNSLNQLHIDLDAENYAKDGVVIDIRNNSGGFVNVYAIDVLARRGYLTMTLRGTSATPARTVLGQRALNRPTILVTNQHSLSDAEDFSEGYRTLRLGQVVGEPTAGWIIYTWNQSLIDGTTFRLPRMKITANDGTNMERHPRPVDVEVTRPIGETLTDHDSQLDVAVRELLKQLSSPRATSPK
ncbi:MAG: tricorn protease [Acidobacteriota bacterium]|jgi:Tol biopolymer transport system component/C-terminal processing protease CtpA/Prc